VLEEAPLKKTIALKSVVFAFSGALTILALWASPARAAVTAPCIVNAGRVVDAQPISGTMRQTMETLGTFKYLQYLPLGHDPAKKWPVIVFMHGSGEASDNGSIMILTKHSLPRVVEDPSWNWPFIVVSPQIDKTSGWLSHANDVSAVLDKLISTYGGDPNRLYLTGLSYGGQGTWELGINLVSKWAALLPVVPGDAVPKNWDQRTAVINMPIWQFHGVLDTNYMANVTDSMQLEASGASKFFRYDYAFTDEYNDVVPKQALQERHVFGSYENIMHDVWYAAYGTFCTTPAKEAPKTTQYLWLLEHSKDGSAYVDPRGTQGIDGGGVPAADGGGTGPTDGGTTTGTAGAGGGAGSSAGAGGAGGSTGTAGSTSGAAGSTSGASGSTGTAGSTTGAAGTGLTGGAGTGSTGSAGSISTGAGGTGPKAKSSGGCAVASGRSASASILAVALVALAMARRRRR
jgi:MYXO-CTERM domain-containing protein